MATEIKIVPVNKDVLILQDVPETKVGAIELASGAVRAKNTGVIVAIGPAVTFGFNSTNYMPPIVGSRCQFSGSAVTAMQAPGSTDIYIIVHEEDVQCLFSE